MRLHESGEMYLETILLLSKKNAAVRSIDVAEHMGFSKPSVSRAIGLLKNAGYVNVDKNGFLTLTESGAEIAGGIYEKHELLTSFFQKIGISPETAERDACRIEHIISDETFDCIKAHVKAKS